MSETKEATYKSLLQRMVHMTEQRDFDEDLMKEVYGALLPPPAEAPSEPSVEEERWARWIDGGGSRWLTVDHSNTKRRAEHFPVIVRSKAADDELKQQLASAINSHVDATEQLEREREDYETLVKEAVELRKQIATPTSSGPADEGWMEKAWLSFYVSAGRVEKDRFLAALRAHAPAARYPEVVEFLDAVGSGPWSMSAGSCEGKASYYVQSFRITKGTWFADDTLAAACRAALDSRKERSDG